jgi:hypothetical protein
LNHSSVESIMVQKSAVGVTVLPKSNANALLGQGVLLGCIGSEYDVSLIADSSKQMHTKTATNRQIICPPSLKPSRRLRKHTTSKSSVRPVFKEPGSKIPITKPPSTTDVSKDWPTPAFHPNSRHQQPRQDPPPGNKSDFVNENTQENQLAIEKHLPSREEIVQPSSNMTERLNRIMGRQSFDNRETPMHKVPPSAAVSMAEPVLQATTFGPPSSHSRRRIHGRRLKMNDFCDDQSDCGTSVATVSDLDYLASKSLRRKKSSRQLGAIRLNLLREEIKEMVVSFDDREEEEDHHVHEEDKDDNKVAPVHSNWDVQEAIEQNNCLGDAQAIRLALESRMMWCRDLLFCNLRRV